MLSRSEASLGVLKPRSFAQDDTCKELIGAYVERR